MYESDETMELRRPQDNPYVQKVYKDYLNKPGSCAAHEYLHTGYKYRKRFNETFEIYKPVRKGNIKVSVCFGNSCMQRGSEEILKHIASFVENGKYKDSVGIEVSMCLEKCFKGPVVKVANRMLEHCTPKAAEEAIQEELMKK